jgi:type IV pilus assembly protein PilY1
MKTTIHTLPKAAFLVLLPMLSGVAISAVTDIANQPLATAQSSTIVRPNIAFIVDDSISMEDGNMPDPNGTNDDKRCWGWYKYNTLAYNPAVTYLPPYKPGGTAYSDGVTRYPNADFLKALKDGFFPKDGKTYSDGTSGSNTETNLSNTSNLTTGSVTCSVGQHQSTIALPASNLGTASNVTSIKVNGVELLNSPPVPSNSNKTKTIDTIGTDLANSINAKNDSFTASYATGTNVLTISSTDPAVVGASPVMIWSSAVTTTTVVFATVTQKECDPDSNGKSRFYYSTNISNANDTSCAADTDYRIVGLSRDIEAPGVAKGSAAAQTNYANWYSYYRLRAYMMKSATAEAFRSLGDGYRVGLFFLNSAESGASSGFGVRLNNRDLAVDTFAGTQRETWFDRLLTHESGGYTPLRGALARVGKMYAGQVSGWDPVQYSCQQNFAILSTDGYWNNNNENDNYGPLTVKGSGSTGKVGNVDGPGANAAATITVSGVDKGENVGVSAITVDGTNILATGGVSYSSNSNTGSIRNSGLASAIATKITQAGYSATASGAVITIKAPLTAGNVTATPVPTVPQGTIALAATAFGGYAADTPKPYRDEYAASNSMADVAYYYYQTDLRTPQTNSDGSSGFNNCSNTIGGTTYSNLCENNVTGAGRDVNNQQHMTTFTIGLGVSGNIAYPNQAQYEDSASWTAWPKYTQESNDSDLKKIDDLWHAAVNGRGTYYSASNANTLAQGIREALAGVAARTGSSSAAATSTLELTTDDHQVFQALYQTVKWDGDLRNCSIDPQTGTIAKDPDTDLCAAAWSAKQTLHTQVAGATSLQGRTIKYFKTETAPGSDNLQEFTYTNLTADGKGVHFANFCSKTPTPTQCDGAPGSLTSTQVTEANKGDLLVNYLRGADTYESVTNTGMPLYRERDYELGDIINSVPVYVKGPVFSYEKYDLTYGAFKGDTNIAGRDPTIYVAANDGMLHAFAVSDGTEKWAFVPSFVMDRMYQLASYNYGANHIFLADGSPTLADICTELDTSAQGTLKPCKAATKQGNVTTHKWKTILVAGLNKGGCGYYALDVTDPNTPKGLWEFTNANLGYSYGNPVVTRRKDGRWVVIFSSGYNNVPNGCGATGDGNGHVFVVDANTGELLEDIPTLLANGGDAGSVASPSGLGKLNAWVEDPYVNVAERIYGGDLLGNLWRIDFDDNLGAGGKEALLLGNLAVAGHAQPITIKPELYKLNAGGYLVLVGTGKYLGAGDPLNTDQQSIYGLKDPNGSTGLGDVRGNATVKARTLTQATDASGALIRTVQPSAAVIDWSTDNGWYIDLNPANASPTERVNVDMQLQYNILTVATNVPKEDACSPSGTSWKYDIDVDTGLAPTTAAGGALASFLGNSLVAGIKVVKLATGQTVTIVTDTSGKIFIKGNPGGTGGGGAGLRRTMWREIFD